MKEVVSEAFLQQLIDRWENEVVEFKRDISGYPVDKIGRYFSALSNEANLRHLDGAWLVFGVDNKTRAIVGCSDFAGLNELKLQMSQNTEPPVTFRDIHQLNTKTGKVFLFEIPAAPANMPIAWKGHYYARSGESLTPLGLDKLDYIRQQNGAFDWTAKIVSEATIDDIDPTALQRAKEAFAKKYANRFNLEEVMSWSDTGFLDRVRLTINGKITRAAILLLGKPESAHYLLPHPGQMTWKLEGQDRAYQHFSPPFLLTSTLLYQKIRNFQLRLLPEDELFAVELAKYDQKVVLEALHNCIAHQDYSRNGRIIVTEMPDRLLFENEGVFYEGKPNDYISGHKTPRRYRNPFIAQAMAELNMIDTMGYGIYEMYLGQARRYFPLPDYDLTHPHEVKITIYGQIVDPAYSRLLMQNTALDLKEIFALDRVQKKLPIDDDIFTILKRKKLIEGRKPNVHVSAFVAKATKNKAEYILKRGQDDNYYQKLIMDYLAKFGSATREEIDNLLIHKLSDVLDEQQKRNKTGNLLTKIRQQGKILNTGSRKKPRWVIKKE